MLAQAAFLRAIDDPVFFVRTVLGAEPEPYQAAILHAVSKEAQVAAHTGHGVGKTTTGSWILIWFLFTRYSKVISTAPTWRQVRDLLWSEVARWMSKADLTQIGFNYPYKLLTTRLEIAPEWYATGEATDDPVKLEGYHAPHILYICDEAKAIPDANFDSMSGGTTAEESKTVMLSTPGASVGKFYRVCTLKEEPGHWKIFHVNAEESERVSKTFIEGRKRVWGETSGIYRMRVKGEFIDLSDDTLVPAPWVEACQETQIAVSRREKRVAGLDLARYGVDDTVLQWRLGYKVQEPVKWNKSSTVESANRVIQLIKDLKLDEVYIDEGGPGAGVVDILLARRGIADKIIPVNASSRSEDPDLYINKRAEMYWYLRSLFQDSKIHIPHDEMLEGQLTSLKYLYTRKGQLQIESKEDRRRRGLASPNEADALALCFAGEAVDANEPGPGIWL